MTRWRPRVPTADLPAMALRVREEILRLTARGGCFVGASLSCADILVHLYGRVLRIAGNGADDPDRDYFFLSKGHDVPALYAVLADLGILDPRRLSLHATTEDDIYWHPNRSVPGVEFHSGSLGHLLSVGLGVALDIRLRRGTNRVFVLLGDGELNEGSVWEACLVASALRLDNLVAIVDRNEFQANARTEELIPLEPLADKFRAFGWSCDTADGHDFAGLESATTAACAVTGKPAAILARTVRGKGVASLEARADRWFARFTQVEADDLVHELHGGAAADLVTEGTVVR